MDYRMLIAMDVVEFLERLPTRHRKSIREGLAEIHRDPLGRSDALDRDETGRVLHVAVIGEFALTYWIDDADRHVKVLDLHAADR